MKCNQCQAIRINGIICHETGCPNSHINLNTGKPYGKECAWCGTEFEPEDKHQKFCSDECAESYNM